MNVFLPNGTGYITDLGMCGPDNSVLGVRTEKIIEAAYDVNAGEFEFAEEHITMHGAVFDIDISDFKCTQVERAVF